MEKTVEDFVARHPIRFGRRRFQLKKSLDFLSNLLGGDERFQCRSKTHRRLSAPLDHPLRGKQGAQAVKVVFEFDLRRLPVFKDMISCRRKLMVAGSERVEGSVGKIAKRLKRIWAFPINNGAGKPLLQCRV